MDEVEAEEKYFSLINRFYQGNLTETQFNYWVQVWKLDEETQIKLDIKFLTLLRKSERAKTFRLIKYNLIWISLLWLWSDIFTRFIVGIK